MTAERHFRYWARLAGLSTFFSGIAIYRGYDIAQVVAVYLSILAVGLLPGVISYVVGGISHIYNSYWLPGFRYAHVTTNRYWKQAAVFVAALLAVAAWLTISGDSDDEFWVSGRATVVSGQLK